VLEGGKSDKILVFHFKRKKQYKKIYGHRQPFTAVRITEIAFDGERFTAPDLPAPKPKKAKPASAEGEAAPAKSAKGKSKSKTKPKAAKKSAAKKAAKGKKK
jgi:large subunit ribosomal protein L21